MTNKDFEIKAHGITFDDLTGEIDFHIGRKRNVVVVCDNSLAQDILEYIWDMYDIEPEHEDCGTTNLKYVSIYFGFRGNMEIYCEDAKYEGGYKVSDLMNVSYYIAKDMSIDDAFNCLQGDESVTYTWVNIEEEDDFEDFEDDIDEEDEESCSCSECNCLDVMIDKYTNKLLESCDCEECIGNILRDMFAETLLNFKRVD